MTPDKLQMHGVNEIQLTSITELCQT